MKLSLTNNNGSKALKKSSLTYNLLFISREREIIITTEDGTELASLRIDTMLDDKDVPTNGFYLSFIIANDISLDKNIATYHDET